MRVLIVGSGAREHALGWKLAKGKGVTQVCFAPGNGGTTHNISTPANRFESLLDFAKKDATFTVVGPEEPLIHGLADIFRKEGLPIFGPSKEAAQIEGSKVFAKEFMSRHNIPTPAFHVFSESENAKDYVARSDGRLVIKADGLAGGKGVYVCGSQDQANMVIDKVMVSRIHGDSGNQVVIEELLDGFEASYIVLTDGKHLAALPPVQDHKRLMDGNAGSNTGGMGAYTPVPMVGERLEREILHIVQKAIHGMRAEGKEFTGALYAGLMVTPDGRPYVLEFNCRFGDPETQVQMLSMESDLYPYLKATADGELHSLEPLRFRKGFAVGVVLASKGYPEKPETGKPVYGLEHVIQNGDLAVFHAGTRRVNEHLFTSGGRVFTVAGFGKDLEAARKVAYDSAAEVRFDGMHFRKDIGWEGVQFVHGHTSDL